MGRLLARPGSRSGARSSAPPDLPQALDLPPALDEDAGLRASLAVLGAAALGELRDVLMWPAARRDALLRSLIGRPGAEPLGQLIAIADTDEVARLRVLRAIRDLTEPRERRSTLPLF